MAGGVERGGWPPASRSPPGPARSAANVKKWEMELQTLRESNARLTAALQESAASVEQWKRQFSICRDENDRLRNKVRDGVPFCFSLPAALTCPPSPWREEDARSLPFEPPTSPLFLVGTHVSEPGVTAAVAKEMDTRETSALSL